MYIMTVKIYIIAPSNCIVYIDCHESMPKYVFHGRPIVFTIRYRVKSLDGIGTKSYKVVCLKTASDITNFDITYSFDVPAWKRMEFKRLFDKKWTSNINAYFNDLCGSVPALMSMYSPPVRVNTWKRINNTMGDYVDISISVLAHVICCAPSPMHHDDIQQFCWVAGSRRSIRISISMALLCQPDNDRRHDVVILFIREDGSWCNYRLPITELIHEQLP